MNSFLGIADTSFNILEEQVFTDTLWNASFPNRFPYYELMFNNPVKVIGDFYVRTDFPKPPSPYDSVNFKYNWIGCDGYYACESRILKIPYIISQERCEKQLIMCKNYAYHYNFNINSLVCVSESDWESMYQSDTIDDSIISILYPQYPYIRGIYMFPIIGEDEEDTVSSLPSVEVENYTNVFPNPTSEDVTVQSSFKMQSIEMFNEQGQQVFETKPNAYNTSINVSSYPKGTYIIKIATKSGTATKKIVVQ